MRSYRPRQVSELIKRELALILSAATPEFSAYFYTVTEVRLSRDLKHAEVWVSVFGDSEKRQAALGALRANVPEIRRRLAAAVYLRRTPELLFRLDETLDVAAKIDSILTRELQPSADSADQELNEE